MTVFDTFLYHGTDTDRRILALRLAETAPLVDRWVLVESALTHSGNVKPLHYITEHRHDPAIAPYAERIIVVHADLPKAASPNSRENIQRAAITDGLHAAGVQPDDWVLMSDLDEVPSADAIGRVLQADRPGVYVFAQRLSYYYLNCLADNQPWHGTRMVRWGEVPNLQALRFMTGHTVNNGGWHMSYLGGVAAIQDKVQAYLHQEFNLPEYTAAEHIAACLAEGRDLFGREGHTYTITPLDDTYPAAVVADNAAHADWITSPVAAPISAE